MMKKMRSSKGFLVTVLCMVMLVGNAIPAMAAPRVGSLQLKNYFYVSVAMEGSASMCSVSKTASNGGIDIGGEIEDWGQAVSAGSSVSASLGRRSDAPSSTVAAPNVEFTWTFVKAGVATETLKGRKVTVPQKYKGGYVNVEASTNGDDYFWAPSKTASKVTIS